MKNIMLIIGLAILLILPIASADILTPTETKVYIDNNGVPVNEKIEFTVKGYGYSWPVGPGVEKEVLPSPRSSSRMRIKRPVSRLWRPIDGSSST